VSDKVVNLFRCSAAGKWRAVAVHWQGDNRTLHFESGRVSEAAANYLVRCITTQQDAIGAACGAMSGGENLREQWRENLSRDEAGILLKKWAAKAQREGLRYAVRWES
jgi:hypothetical protein